MAGTLKVNNFQLGDSATATNNFVVKVPATPNGTMVISNGNVGSETDKVSFDSSGNATIPSVKVGTNASNGQIAFNGTSLTTTVPFSNGIWAWISFYWNGSAVVVRGSYNCTVVRNAVGDYSINFTTALPDANYAAILSGTGTGYNISLAQPHPSYTPTASTIRVICQGITGTSNAAIDPVLYYAAIVR